MMRLPFDTTDLMLMLYVTDASGAAATGLAHDASGLSVEYRKDDESSWTALSLSAGTLGTYGSEEWVEEGNGAYQVGLPAAAKQAGGFTRVRWTYDGVTSVPETVWFNAPNIDASGSAKVVDHEGSTIRAAVDASTLAGKLAGIGSLGGWLRLLMRKDAAVATDEATSLGEINADGGSGAGAFDNTTDSTEAVKDGLGSVGTPGDTGTVVSATTTTVLVSGLAKTDGAYARQPLRCLTGPRANLIHAVLTDVDESGDRRFTIEPPIPSDDVASMAGVSVKVGG